MIRLAADDLSCAHLEISALCAILKSESKAL
jgi:hypothetical protein